jgi:cobalt-zinc-cadmium efflux system outer membrane protein
MFISNPVRRAMRGRAWVPLLGVAALTGCSLAPKEAASETQRVKQAGAPYERPFAQRELPEIPPEPTWREVLHRAFLANGELESAYFDWKASVQRIGIASAYPNTNLTLGYSYMFSSGRMNTFDRSTFTASPDSMLNLSFPTKIAQAGKVALDQARAAGERFRETKFELQQRVLSAWADYGLMAERIRVERENLSLLQVIYETAGGRIRAGGRQGDLLRAEVAQRLSEDKIKTLEAEQSALRANLNGMLARAADAPLAAPKQIEMRAVPNDDDRILAAGVDQNPKLAGLARQVEGRKDALELARMQWVPDINPSVAFTGGVAQVIGAGVVLPTTIIQIRGMIHEAQSYVASSEAMLRQTRSDRAASFLAALIAMRDSEREAAFFADVVLPATHRVLASSRQAYAVGQGGLSDVIETQRTLLDVRLTLSQAWASREKSLAEIESLAGVDIDTLFGLPERPSDPTAALPVSQSGGGR